MNGPPGTNNGFHAGHVLRLNESLLRLTGKPLLPGFDAAEEFAEAVFNAPFVVLSSGTEPDPLFNYANQTALDLFELDWTTLIELPARESAEPLHQASRAELMARVLEHGFIDDYSGVRISRTGKRFMIENATVWNVIDADGRLHGQAATFADWRAL